MESVRAAKLQQDSIEPSSTASATALSANEPRGASSSSVTVDESFYEPSTSLDASVSVHFDAHPTASDSEEETSDDEDFTVQNAHHIYHDLVQQQPKDTVKMMAVMTMDAFIAQFGLTSGGAAREAGLLLHLNEKTVRMWRKDGYANQGSFSRSKQGRHVRPYVLDDEEC